MPADAPAPALRLAPRFPFRSSPDSTLTRALHTMGTVLRVSVAGVPRETAVAVMERAFAAVARVDDSLSSWRDDSEVGRLNSAAPGSEVSLSSELASLLTEADRWVTATGGAFDPAVGALVDAWDLRGSGRTPTPGEVATALARSGWGQLRWTDSARSGLAHEEWARRPRTDSVRVLRGPEGWWLDTGAFGKGAALGAAAEALRAGGVSDALLDFGGQLLVLGGPREVAVADPERRDRVVARLLVAGASVATTSSSERFVTVDGERLGHVLDPRTGRPVPAWGSVTVVAEDPLAADALSTGLFVMGAEAALAWARGREDVGVLVLRPSADGLEASWNRTLEPLLLEAPRRHEPPAPGEARARRSGATDAHGGSSPVRPAGAEQEAKTHSKHRTRRERQRC